MSFAELILHQYGFDSAFQVTGGSIPTPPSLRPTFQYLIAFQDVPTVDPTTLTVAPGAAGTLGAAGQWTDVTPYVMSHRLSRGRQHELSQFEAGTAEMVLSNRDGRFSPWNTAGPYYGFLVPRRPLQVRVSWNGVTYNRFTGHTDAWPVEWPDPFSAWTSLHATDAFRFFNLNNVTTAGYPTQVIADGPVAYWRLGDPVGTVTSATSALPGGGPAAVSPSSGTITFGQGGGLPADVTSSVEINYSFNSSDASAPTLSAASPPAIVTASGFSVELWVQMPVANAANTKPQLQIPFTMAGVAGVAWLNINSTGVTLTDAYNTLGNFGGAAGTVGDGKWHHVVATLTAAWAGTFYLDGVSIGTHAFSAFTAGTQFPPYLANLANGGGTTGDAFFQDWALYPSVLNAAQVANHYALASFPQQRTDQRVAAILNAVAWSSTARNLDSNTTTVQAVASPLTSTSSLSHMQAVESTEGGALFMGTDGRVNFRSRQSLFSGNLYTQPQAVIGDNYTNGDLPFDPGPVIALDDIDLYNEAVATRQGGNTQRTTNTASITNNGRATWQPPSSLLGISDAEVLALTQYVVFKFNTPVTRVQSVTVDLLNLITPNLVGNLLGLDLLQQVTVERLGVPGGGQGFSQTANIEHITEVATPDQYKISFGFAKSDPPFWVLGQSQLGSTTTLAW